MKKVVFYCITFFLFILANSSFAREDSGGVGFCVGEKCQLGTIHLLVGAGFQYGMSTFTQISSAPVSSNANAPGSKFNGLGWNVKGGVEIPIFRFLGLRGLAEVGSDIKTNSINTQNTLEISKNSYMTFEAQVLISRFGIGGGIRQNSIQTTGVSAVAPVAGLQTNYKGLSYFGSANISIPGNEFFGTLVEYQYHSGNFDTAKVSENIIQLDLIINLGVK